MTLLEISTTSRPEGRPIWCAGCGHFGVEKALKVALRNLEVPSYDTLVLAGIGCSGTIQNNLGTYGYHALHGRVLPSAAGAALANPDLTVVAAGGDGDGYAIGGGHLLHAFRRNLPFVYIVMNNETYGLTKGQQSPTREHAYDSHTERSLDSMQLGLSISGTSFLARGYSGAFDQLVALTEAAITHARTGKGFAFLEVISPCVTYYDAYATWESRIVDLDDDPTYDPRDRAGAFTRSLEMAETGRMVTGQVFIDEVATVSPRMNPFGADLSPIGNGDHLRQVVGTYMVNKANE